MATDILSKIIDIYPKMIKAKIGIHYNQKIFMKLPIKMSDRLDISEILFLLAICMKQFYLWKSGVPQVGDILFIISFFTYAVRNGVSVEKIDYSFIIFLYMIASINLIYSFFYSEYSFDVSTLYWLYNFLIIILFRRLLYSDLFVHYIIKALKLNLIIQLFVNFSGMSRMYGARYKGTFNDPNQFAFFVISCFFLLFLLSKYDNSSVNVIWYLITGYMIIKSASMGMLGAFIIFLTCMIIMKLGAGKSAIIKRTLVVLAVILFIIGLIMGIHDIILKFDEIAVTRNWFSLQRIMEKVHRFKVFGGKDSAIFAFFNDRASTRLIREPIYYLYGCGEGYTERFVYDNGSEIHCTMLAVCYYYGIIPYFFFLRWIYKNIHKIQRMAIPVYIAIIIEAFTLANHRQPFFWMMFVLGGLLKRDDTKQIANSFSMRIRSTTKNDQKDFADC